MGKYKYQFDPETLIYKKIKLDFKTRFYKKWLPKFAGSLIVGFLIFIITTLLFQSPIEIRLDEEKQALLLEYDRLNRQVSKADLNLHEVEKNDDNVYRKIFQAKPIPESVRKAGFGGVNRYEKYEGYENSNVLIGTAKRLDILSKQLVVQSKSFDEIIDLVKNKEKMLASIPAIQPIALDELTRFGSAFGYRIHPIYKYRKMHTGVDLTAPRGTKIHAAGDGVVVRSDWAGGYGNCVRINHGYGYLTLYGHMSKTNVRPGQKVKRGDVIGYVGSTGLSTSPHLHYEVRINGKFVNPVNFYHNDLTDEEYDKMIEMSSKSNTHIFE
ncbi:MAG: peptidase M23 [Bacteroidetes bacterium 4572_117]|nr:MAG: peptidase M23 [Bacteroidetes bacterium 4572_117]